MLEPAGDRHGVVAVRVNGRGAVRMGHTEPWLILNEWGERSNIDWSTLASLDPQLIYPTLE